MRMTLIPLPSPVLGPAVWEPAAENLRSQGWPVRVPSTPLLDIECASDVIERWKQDLPPAEPVVLLPHSNAGLIAPLLSEVLNVVGYVFVDARLPGEKTAVRLGPAGFEDFLGPLTDESGYLPPWTNWWGAGGTDHLFPDSATRCRVESEAPRLPIAYFHQQVNLPPNWASVPCAYLAFGETYREERAHAQDRGWPTQTVHDAEHLHMLLAPHRTTTEITNLLQAMTLTT